MTTAPSAPTTAVLDAPTDTEPDAATASRGLTFLSKAVKVTGYARVGTGALAAGTYQGQPARLVVPVEWVAAADVRVRIGGTRLLVNVTGAHPGEALATRAAQAAARACGLEFGEIQLTLRLPQRPSIGTDIEEATVLAVIDAIDKACEHGLRTSARAALAADVLDGKVAGLAAAGPALVATDGQILAQPDEPARLLAVVIHPADGGAGIADADADANFGALTTPPATVTGAAALAGWLAACSGDSDEPVAALVRATTTGLDGVLAVVGGHLPTSPVVVLLDPARLDAAQQITHQLLRSLPDGWVASTTRTAIG